MRNVTSRHRTFNSHITLPQKLNGFRAMVLQALVVQVSTGHSRTRQFKDRPDLRRGRINIERCEVRGVMEMGLWRWQWRESGHVDAVTRVGHWPVVLF